MIIGKQFIRVLKPTIENSPSWHLLIGFLRTTGKSSKNQNKTQLGFKFMGNLSMEKGTHEIEEREIIQRILERVDIFINVGATIGYYCCLSLQKGKHTIAFEPIQSNLNYSYKNIIANHWENNIEIYPIAVLSG